MTRHFSSSLFHVACARLLLVAFTLRALIPVGFMPSSEHRFTLEICPDGFPVQLLPGSSIDHSAHAAVTHASPAHDHPQSHDPGSPHRHSTGSGHCAFAVAASGPRLADIPLVAIQLETLISGGAEYVSPSFGLHRFLLAQPRAPPTLT